MYFDSPVKVAAYSYLLLICGYALWRGGGPERTAAILIAVDWLATPLLLNHDSLRYMQGAVFGIDLLLTVALFAIAIGTNRFWPLWTAAFLLLEVLMHVAMLIDHRVRPRAYYIGMEIWSYLSVAALGIGTWLEAPQPALTPFAINRLRMATGALSKQTKTR